MSTDYVDLYFYTRKITIHITIVIENNSEIVSANVFAS